MLTVAIVSALVLVSLAVLVVSIVKLVIAKEKKPAFFLVSCFSFFALLIADGYLAGSYVIKNHEAILSNLLDASSDVTSDSLARTASSFEKNWDKELIENFGKVSVSARSVRTSPDEKGKKYEIEVLIENGNDESRKMYLRDMIGNNYLVACDSEDIAYPLIPKDLVTDKIPVGKSLVDVEVTVKEKTELTYLRFLRERIDLPAAE